MSRPQVLKDLLWFASALVLVGQWIVVHALQLHLNPALGGRLVYEFGVGGTFGASHPSPETEHHHH